MTTTLLATKLRVPPLSQYQVPRNRLSDVLESGISHYKLILVSAPAGYGKTTLLSQWANATSCHIAWLSLDAEDNDLERFLRYLFAAWETIQPKIRESELGLLLGAISPDSDATLTAFINMANESPERTVFILDDYHLIEDVHIHKALAFLLDHLPPSIHFLIAGRSAPPLPLARYRARSELLELRAEELQFSPDETANYLNDQMGLQLAPKEVDTLQAHLEGWIAGLHLAALSFRQDRQTVNKLVSGQHRHIADYLSEDVLAHQPDAVQRFLLQTSILDRLCGALCDAVTEQQNGQEMLEFLESENLFLMPLDSNRRWYRYHQLFADFLRDALYRRMSDQVPHLHRRAARWYLEHDLPEHAFQHALNADDVELVVQILDGYLSIKLNSGEIRVVERWIDALRPDWYSTYPMLGLAQVAYLAYMGDFDGCLRQLHEVDQQLTPAENERRRWQQTRVIAVRCLMACMQNDLAQAEALAQEALQALPDEDLSWRTGIYNALGDAYRQSGLWGSARECYLKALSGISPPMRFMSAQLYGALADLALRQGHLQDAERHWRQALEVIEEPTSWGRQPLPISGWIYIRLAELLYEWNALDEARDYLSKGMERAELGGDVRSLIAGYLIAGRLKLTERDVEAAADYLEQARPLVAQAQFSHWISRYERFQLDVWLAQDRLRAAVDWSDRMLGDAHFDERPESEVTQLAVARALIIKGDMPAIERALALLDDLLETAESEGRIGVKIEALVLQALAEWQRGNRAEALTELEPALRLAEPEGYLRLFADLGLPVVRLLQEARDRQVGPDYVATLLGVFGQDLAPESTTILPEPLTQREQEILELVAAGLTNPEIAEKLVISPETVKKHTSNIYGKLGVSNRTEAAARARELDRLD